MAYNKSRSKNTPKDLDTKDKYNSKSKSKRRTYSKNSRPSRDKNTKSGYSGTDEDSDDSKSRFMNDPNWYIADLKTMEQAMGFSFDNFIGRDNTLEIHNTVLDTGKTASAVDAVGSIAVIKMMPSPGYIGKGSQAKLSAINQQGFKLYARLSSVNSKNTQYAPQDVTTLILAMGEVVSMISEIQRAFGLLWTYNIRNRQMPSNLIHATGIDADDFYANIAQYRIRFNTTLVQANKIPFPSNIDYFTKCAQLYSDVYKDSEDDMSQMFVFRPVSTWVIDETGSSEGTVLRTTAVPTNMGKLLDLLDTMLNTLLTSATYNYIYSDIINYLNRPGNSATLLNYATIPDNYVVIPVYNYAMLGQITNITTMDEPMGTSTSIGHTVNNDVIPDMTNLCLNYAPLFVNYLPAAAMDRYLNFGEQDPDVYTRIENTRYMSMAIGSNWDSTKSGFLTTEAVLGDHFCTQIEMITSGKGGSNFRTDYERSNAISLATRAVDFDWAPLLYTWNVDANKNYSLLGVVGDMKYFTTINPSTMKLINELALYGLYEPKDFEYELVK